MSSYIDDTGSPANNWQQAEFDKHADVLTCSRCEQPICEHEVDGDASEAFEHVCKECADRERAEAAAEDAQVRQDTFAGAADAIARAHWQAQEMARVAGVPFGMPKVARPYLDPDAETRLRSQQIVDDFDKWWLLQGCMHFVQLQRGLLWADATRETARMAWLAGAVKATEVSE